MSYGQNAPFGLKPLQSMVGGSFTEKANPYYIYASDDGTSTYNKSIFTGDPVVLGSSMGNAAASASNGKYGTIAVYNPGFADGSPSQFSVIPILGVFVGCEYISTSTTTNNAIWSSYWPAGTQVRPGTKIKAYVLDDPNIIYDIQVSTSKNAANNAWVGQPFFPNANTTGGDIFIYAGHIGRNFALNIGPAGGGDFSDGPDNPATGLKYNNNPQTGNIQTGQSAFYLDVDTSTAAGYNGHDYAKNVATLPLRVVGYTQHPKNVADASGLIERTPFINVRVMINNRVWANGTIPPGLIA